MLDRPGRLAAAGIEEETEAPLLARVRARTCRSTTSRCSARARSRAWRPKARRSRRAPDLELKLVEVGRYDLGAGVGKLDGLTVVVGDALELVGKKVKVRIERVLERRRVRDARAGGAKVPTGRSPPRPRPRSRRASRPARSGRGPQAGAGGRRSPSSSSRSPKLSPSRRPKRSAERRAGRGGGGRTRRTTPEKPKKKTRRGSRGGRRRRKPAAGGAPRGNGQVQPQDADGEARRKRRAGPEDPSARPGARPRGGEAEEAEPAAAQADNGDGDGAARSRRRRRAAAPAAAATAAQAGAAQRPLGAVRVTPISAKLARLAGRPARVLMP